MEALDGAGREHQPPQLGEDPLAGGLRDARAAAAVSRSVSASGVKLGGEAREPERPERVALVGLRADHPEGAGLDVGSAAERVDHVASLPGPRHRVDREVALPQVLLDVAPWSGAKS